MCPGHTKPECISPWPWLMACVKEVPRNLISFIFQSRGWVGGLHQDQCRHDKCCVTKFQGDTCQQNLMENFGLKKIRSKKCLSMVQKYRFNKTQVASVQLGKTLDLNLQVFSFLPRDRVKCGGLGWEWVLFLILVGLVSVCAKFQFPS